MSTDAKLPNIGATIGKFAISASPVTSSSSGADPSVNAGTDVVDLNILNRYVPVFTLEIVKVAVPIVSLPLATTTKFPTTGVSNCQL